LRDLVAKLGRKRITRLALRVSKDAAIASKAAMMHTAITPLLLASPGAVRSQRPITNQ
jgi:hypothetical protein